MQKAQQKAVEPGYVCVCVDTGSGWLGVGVGVGGKGMHRYECEVPSTCCRVHKLDTEILQAQHTVLPWALLQAIANAVGFCWFDEECEAAPDLALPNLSSFKKSQQS